MDKCSPFRTNFILSRESLSIDKFRLCTGSLACRVRPLTKIRSYLRSFIADTADRIQPLFTFAAVSFPLVNSRLWKINGATGNTARRIWKRQGSLENGTAGK